jgi:hypothetical protein
VLQPHNDGALIWTMPTGHRHVISPSSLIEPETDVALIAAANRIAEARRHESTAERALATLLAA